MKKYIVLHDNIDNTPIIVFVDAITVINANNDNSADVLTLNWGQKVRESIGDVMKKLKEVQDEDCD